MGTSFVEFKGFGFWTRDSFLESWLSTLLIEMQRLPANESWQQSLMEHWRVQSQVDGGVMSLQLDEFLTDDQRKECVLSLASNALKHTKPNGHRTGELFISLLKGELDTTASSPIDYFDDSSG